VITVLNVNFQEEPMKQSGNKIIILTVILLLILNGCITEEAEEMLDHDDNNQSETGGNNLEETAKCGNSFIDEGEVCDGGALNCTEIDNKYEGGIAVCKQDCSGWDTSICVLESQENDNQTPSEDNEDNGEENDSPSGFDKNSDGFWADPDTLLIWEEPAMLNSMSGFGTSIANATAYCENLFLAGANDWRVPTIDELRTIVRGVSTTMTDGRCPTTESCSNQDECNKDGDNSLGFGNSCLGCQALDSKYDPAFSYLEPEDCYLTERETANGDCYMVENLTLCDKFWSSTPNTATAGATMNAQWYLNFKRGLINSAADILNIEAFVRCVRSGTEEDVPVDQPLPEPPAGTCTKDSHCEEGQWCENKKCVVIPEPYWTDSSTGLMWQSGEVQNRTWQEAMDYCDGLDYEGYTDWKLPNLDELKSLVKGCDKTASCTVTTSCTGYTACHNDNCSDGCASGNYLPPEVGQQKSTYWTSDEEEQTPQNAWMVNFTTGSVSYLKKTWDNQLARCVRTSN
jgi:hypothetical protein